MADISTASEKQVARPAQWSAQVLPADASAIDAYACFCSEAVFPPPQSPLWTRAWLEDAGTEGLVAILYRGEKPAAALALEVVTEGPFRLARFAGGSHANGNFPAVHPAVAPAGPEAATAMQAMLAAIKAARPEIDLLALERQRHSFRGLANPVLALPHAASPDLSLAVDLTGGMERLLEGRGGKRRRKKHRSQLRKLEAAGGYRRFVPGTVEEADALLDLFFRLKRERLTRMGATDAFAPPHVQAGLRRLFRSALGEPVPPFVLHALEVGGKVRAITGSSRLPDGIVCEFNAFAEDDLASLSPGDFLFHENIAEACAEGLAFYDFSVGDAPYKRAWCDIETGHADVFAGLSARGKLLALLCFARTGLKRVVKQNPAMSRLARRALSLHAASRPGGAVGGT